MKIEQVPITRPTFEMSHDQLMRFGGYLYKGLKSKVIHLKELNHLEYMLMQFYRKNYLKEVKK